MHSLRLPFSLASAVCLIACSSGSTPSDTCTAPLQRFDCPPTFDAAKSMPCAPYVARAWTGSCGAYSVFGEDVGASTTLCFYASTSGTLVGAKTADDTPHCNGASVLTTSDGFDTSCTTGPTTPACMRDAGTD
jgi:hypothetical protein